MQSVNAIRQKYTEQQELTNVGSSGFW